MKKQVFIFVIVVAIISYSCSDKSAVSTTVKFTSSQATFSESSGTVSIPISISGKESSNVTVYYTWNSPTDTTYLGGDFNIDNIGSTVISSGQTSGAISLQVLDDTQIDGQDDIKFIITSVSGGSAKLSSAASDVSTEVFITDNDSAPSDKLQIDITWHLKDPTANINGVNLDLYSLYGVVISGDTIKSPGAILSSSKNASGFETIFINSSDPDQDYFFAISYTTGSSNLTYTLVLNGLGLAGEHGSGSFKSTDVTYASFYGPFTKAGSSFSGRTSSIMNFRNLGLQKLH